MKTFVKAVLLFICGCFVLGVLGRIVTDDKKTGAKKSMWFNDDGSHVSIKGVSINLPYDKLVAELERKCGKKGVVAPIKFKNPEASRNPRPTVMGLKLYEMKFAMFKGGGAFGSDLYVGRYNGDGAFVIAVLDHEDASDNIEEYHKTLYGKYDFSSSNLLSEKEKEYKDLFYKQSNGFPDGSLAKFSLKSDPLGLWFDPEYEKDCLYRLEDGFIYDMYWGRGSYYNYEYVFYFNQSARNRLEQYELDEINKKINEEKQSMRNEKKRKEQYEKQRGDL